MLVRVAGLLCISGASVASSAKAVVQQEIVRNDPLMIKQDDSAAAKVMMRREFISKHDYGKEFTVSAARSSGEEMAELASKGKQPELNAAGDSSESTSSVANSIETLKMGESSTGNPSASNASSNASHAAKHACFIEKGLKVISVKDSKGKYFNMAIREDQDVVSQRLEKDGYYQIRKPEDLATLAGKPMPPSGTFMDIGASVGWYTMLFARAGYKVIAIEPILSNRQALNATLCLNPKVASNVKILPLALVSQADRKKTCVMSFGSQDNQGTGAVSCSIDPFELPCSWDNSTFSVKAPTKSSAVPAKAPGNALKKTSADLTADPVVSGSTSAIPAKALKKPSADSTAKALLQLSDKPCYQVKVNTLDVLLSEMAPIIIDFMKIDVDGMECDVMRSGESVFWRYNVKFLQVTTQSAPVAQCFVQQAKRHGYIVGRHEGEDLNKVMYRHQVMTSLEQESEKELLKPTVFTLSKALG